MANVTIATKYGTAPRATWDGTEKIPLDVGGADGVGLASTLKTYVNSNREILAANRTYYVATTGNDTTGDGAVGTPWATPQKAYTFIRDNLNLNNKIVTIQCADGTYSDTVPILDLSGSGDAWFGGGGLVFQGNLGNRTAVVWSNTSTTSQCILTGSTITGDVTIQFLQAKLPDASSWPVIDHSSGVLIADSVDVGGSGTSGYHYLVSSRKGLISVRGNYTILATTGTMWAHISLVDGCYGNNFANFVVASALTVQNFYEVYLGSQLDVTTGVTGAAVTGKKYHVYSGGILNLYNYDPSMVPGSLTGLFESGSIVRSNFSFSQGVRIASGLPVATYLLENSFAVFKDTSGNGVYIAYNDEGTLKPVGTAPVAYASLPTPAVEGMTVPITNSNVNTFGATITGAGAYKGLAYYDGTNWTFR